MRAKHLRHCLAQRGHWTFETGTLLSRYYKVRCRHPHFTEEETIIQRAEAMYVETTQELILENKVRAFITKLCDFFLHSKHTLIAFPL